MRGPAFYGYLREWKKIDEKNWQTDKQIDEKKQQTEKIEKHWKIFKIFSIINLKTILYKPIASDKFIQIHGLKFIQTSITSLWEDQLFMAT